MEQIKTVSIEDKNYPALLKKISNPSKIIYVKGELLKNDLCFGVVGTRRFSYYGKEVASEIAGDLAEAGLTIVSGLAPGIDTFSHLAALNRNGRTIAVLGTGLDEKSIYPRSNLKLAREIVGKGGALISEYPAGTRGARFTFPQRNRIIAGLSLGILVVEGKIKSGSLITAKWAFSQKRKVFAVPGPIYSSNSQGPNYLIKKGAKLVCSTEDILQELNLSVNNRKKASKIDNQEEGLILKILSEEALNVDEIIEKTKLHVQLVNKTLIALESKNEVKNLGGNIYAVNHR